ncbi:hypothetical protein T4B_2391 [Trichinella pseudospiralis]|uniref:Uncharacterized protein n=2 Tax=Trichinella pseudospiralis TaxID=6337 RepID=A0A0V1IPD3_TRIPS|nr:hypothetical protein T4D_10673 [Trichinella pseudospiralis]KRZ24407.1 hypothetical protein T4B_2391 [Trichinella pseudospiralis]
MPSSIYFLMTHCLEPETTNGVIQHSVPCRTHLLQSVDGIS